MIWEFELKAVSCVHLLEQLDAHVATTSADLNGEDRERIKVASTAIRNIATSGRFWNDAAVVTVGASWDGKRVSIHLELADAAGDEEA